MYDRWNRSNANLPSRDKQDIAEENPVFNNGKKPSPEHQHHPEFTQSSYLRIRSMEEAFLMTNYFDKVKTTKSSSIKEDGMTDYLRSYGIQKIFDLH